MTQIVFLRHFETEIDEETPVSEWELTERGERGMQSLLDSEVCAGLDRVYSSPEHKALRTARAVAEREEIPLVETPTLAEVDRSGEGFVPEQEYQRMVAAYFRRRETAFDWENRRSVMRRIEEFFDSIAETDERVMVVSHGLLLSTLLGDVVSVNSYEFWQELAFGEQIEMSLGELHAARNE